MDEDSLTALHHKKIRRQKAYSLEKVTRQWVGLEHLGEDEMQRGREKGLCFNCDEWFTPGHRCKARQAFLIELVESDAKSQGEAKEKLGSGGAEISVHDIMGTHGPRTMKLEA